MAQMGQIGGDILAAGEDHRVRAAQLVGVAHHAQPHIRLNGQGIEIGKVGDVRQVDDRDVEAVFCHRIR